MSRLVVVSNRLPSVRISDSGQEPEVPAGGLASAILGALRRSPESLWFGWNGRTVESLRSARVTRQRIDGVELVGLALTRSEYEDYYLGYCNAALWPLFHCFQGRAKFRIRQEERYRAVQTRFAAVLRPMLRPGDVVWIHDYHLIPLGRELRQAGWTGPLGFFLHIPFPPHDLWQVLPDPRDLLAAMVEYDLVGFHVTSYLDNYAYCCKRELGATWDGSVLTAGERRQRAGVYPVGIDPGGFLPKDRGTSVGKPREVLGRVVKDRRLILGVDRLDYTKGVPERIQAYETFIRRRPEWRKRVVFVQIASPSRTEVPEYVEQKKRVDALIGRVNGEMGEHDWVPIRYLYRSYSREFLAKIYSEADVGLVTPLRDGMNLVAKEFVASQDPQNPGVLVLSRCAGAAQELEEAIIVNPFIPSSVAKGIETAVSMSVEERRERHAALLRRVLSATAADWSRRFLEDLAAV